MIPVLSVDRFVQWQQETRDACLFSRLVPLRYMGASPTALSHWLQMAYGVRVKTYVSVLPGSSVRLSPCWLRLWCAFKHREGDCLRL